MGQDESATSTLLIKTASPNEFLFTLREVEPGRHKSFYQPGGYYSDYIVFYIAFTRKVILSCIKNVFCHEHGQVKQWTTRLYMDIRS